MASVAVLTISVLSFAQAVVLARRQTQNDREVAFAVHAARRVLEELPNHEFSTIFARYNAAVADDPVGAAPGASFEVEGLAGDVGATGSVMFPVDGAGQLREDLDLPEFGLPRDLNADGIIDSADHSGDYVILPVTVRIEWTGVVRNQVQFQTFLVQR